jgi:hypothetical protein
MRLNNLNLIIKHIFVILTTLGVLFLTFQTSLLKISPVSGTIDTKQVRTLGADYRSYYYASKSFLTGDNVYIESSRRDQIVKRALDSFIYPPLMTTIFVLPSLLPFNISYALFTVFSIILFILSIYLISKILPRSKTFFWLVVLSFFLSPILVLHLDRGQTDILIILLVVSSLISLLKKESYLSGVLIGIAGALKITPLIFLPYLFIKDKRSFWTSIITIVFTSCFFGLDIWMNFIERFRTFSIKISSGNLSNSLIGVFHNDSTAQYLSHDGAMIIYYLLIIIPLCIIFTYIYINRKSDKTILLEYGVLSVFMIIVPSISWAYNGVHSIILLAGYWSFRFDNTLSKKLYFLFDVFAYILISQPVLSILIREYPIYHVFSLRPLIYLCFVGLFIYILINKYRKNLDTTTTAQNMLK